MSLCCLVNTAAVTRITLGYYTFSMRFRFAGLINPSIPIMQFPSKVDQEQIDAAASSKKEVVVY